MPLGSVESVGKPNVNKTLRPAVTADVLQYTNLFLKDVWSVTKPYTIQLTIARTITS